MCVLRRQLEVLLLRVESGHSSRQGVSRLNRMLSVQIHLSRVQMSGTQVLCLKLAVVLDMQGNRSQSAKRPLAAVQRHNVFGLVSKTGSGAAGVRVASPEEWMGVSRM